MCNLYPCCPAHQNSVHGFKPKLIAAVVPRVCQQSKSFKIDDSHFADVHFLAEFVQEKGWLFGYSFEDRPCFLLAVLLSAFAGGCFNHVQLSPPILDTSIIRSSLSKGNGLNNAPHPSPIVNLCWNTWGGNQQFLSAKLFHENIWVPPNATLPQENKGLINDLFTTMISSWEFKGAPSNPTPARNKALSMDY